MLTNPVKELTLRKEKRGFARVPCYMDLDIRSEGGHHEVVERVEALNLSLVGLGVQREAASTPNAWRPGTTVSVGMQGLPTLKAKVRWATQSKLGVMFCGCLQDVVESWVGEVLAAQGVKVGDLLESD